MGAPRPEVIWLPLSWSPRRLSMCALLDSVEHSSFDRTIVELFRIPYAFSAGVYAAGVDRSGCYYPAIFIYPYSIL